MRLAQQQGLRNSISIDFVLLYDFVFVNVESVLNLHILNSFIGGRKPNKWPNMRPKSGLNAKLYWLICAACWWERQCSFQQWEPQTQASVCVCMRPAYETFQIAAGWSNICFKDVLQAPPSPSRTNRPISPEVLGQNSNSTNDNVKRVRYV